MTIWKSGSGKIDLICFWEEMILLLMEAICHYLKMKMEKIVTLMKKVITLSENNE